MSISVNQEDILLRFDDLAARVAWMEQTYEQRHLEDDDRIHYLEDESQRLNTCNIHLQSSLMAMEERMLRIIDSLDLLTAAHSSSNSKQLNSIGANNNNNNTTHDINSIGSSSRNGSETQNDINSLYKLAGKSLKAQKQVFEELSIIRQALAASKQLDPNPSFPLQQTIIENYKKNQDGDKQQQYMKEDTRNSKEKEEENNAMRQDNQGDFNNNLHGNSNNGYLDTQQSQQYEHNPIHRLFGREEEKQQQPRKNANKRYRNEQSNQFDYNNNGSLKEQENNIINQQELLPQGQQYQGQMLSSQKKLSKNQHRDQLFTFTENSNNHHHRPQQPFSNHLNNSSYADYLRNSSHNNQPIWNSDSNKYSKQHKLQENSFEAEDYEILHQRKSKNGSVLDYTIQYHDNIPKHDRQMRQSRSGSLENRHALQQKIHSQSQLQNNNNVSIESGKRNINSECKRKKKCGSDKDTIRGSSSGRRNNHSSSKKALQRQSSHTQSNSHQKQSQQQLHHHISSEQQVFRNTPFGTEKSREREIQSRLQLERRIKDEKIQLLEGIARQSPNRFQNHSYHH